MEKKGRGNPKFKSKLCNKGANCEHFKRGICNYLHDEDVIASEPQVQPKPQRQQVQEPRQKFQQKIHEEEKKYIARPKTAVQKPLEEVKYQARVERKLPPQREEPQIEEVKRPQQKFAPRQPVQIPRNQNQSQQYFTAAVVKELAFHSFDKIIETFSKVELSEALNRTEFKGETNANMIEILFKLTSGDLSRSGQFLPAFIDSKFFKIITDNYLKEFIEKTIDLPQYVQKERYRALEQLIDSITKLIELNPTRYSTFPVNELSAIVEDFSMLSEAIQPANFQMIKGKMKTLKENYTITRLSSITQKVQKKEEEKKQIVTIDESYKQDPPDDFTAIEIIPTQAYFDRYLNSNQIPFLRKMPSEPADLRNSHNYLDIIFRLLHEDAIRPLREGVAILKQEKKFNQRNHTKKDLKEKQIRIYQSLVLSNIMMGRDGTYLNFRLDVKNERQQDWRASKKLMAGSLVILSCDNFHTCFAGLIMQRDNETMNKTQQQHGYVTIGIDLRESGVGSIMKFFIDFKSSEFDLIESSAYFVSYNHVLKQIKEMDSWQNVPLSKYIVNGEREMDEPIYIQQIQNDGLGHTLRQRINSLGLDESQQEALSDAIQSKLGIIQGPPGTGKTFVGQQIVNLLLQFKQYWEEKGPILIVTYTNHALNQFLHLVKGFTKKIVRIGGRCDDLELQQYNYIEICKTLKLRKHRSFYETLDELTYCEAQFKRAKVMLLAHEFKVITRFIKSEVNKAVLDDLLYEVRQGFDNQCKTSLNLLIKQQKYKDSAYEIKDYTMTRIKRKIEHDKDVAIVFWLGFVKTFDFVKYLMDEYLEKFANNELNEEDFRKYDVWNDYIDERMQDYSEFEKQIYSEEVEECQLTLAGLFFPGFQGQELQNCFTFEECVQQGGETGELIQDQAQLLRLVKAKKPFSMSFEERWSINNSLMNFSVAHVKQTVDQLIQNQGDLLKEKERIQNMCNKQIFKDARIVAMTTTGCAKYKDLLMHVKFPILIVEEAAEVFEAHITTALRKQTDQVILIGDHKQLKPNPSIFELAVKFNLSMSMFERLIRNQVAFKTLAHQRRMRPEIAEIMKLIYPTLQNHPIVRLLPQVKGIATNVFFFHHTNPESENPGMMSKLNKFEGDMIIRFARYLLKHNYKHDKITILTLYAGQLLYIKGEVKKFKEEDLARIRVCNVDNFQGEENDIILLSLTRSNPGNNIGFLEIYNRVCVALSRARQGLYIFGNSECLLKYRKKNDEDVRSDLWKNILDYLQNQSFFGRELILQCVNHKVPTNIKVVADWQKVPEGGCNKICSVRMGCGHACDSFCHPFNRTEEDETGHDYGRCTKVCVREKACGHGCSYKCYECKKNKICLPCSVVVTKHFERCGHDMRVKCSNYATQLRCENPCDKYLPCTHKCKLYCHEVCGSRPCREQVIKVLPCNHEIEVDCGKTMAQILNEGCPSSCPEKLPCGHPCFDKCGQCAKRGYHSDCKQNCKRVLICGHQCEYPCTKNCPPCQKQCKTHCKHSRCNLQCGKVCVLCKEPCENRCEHTKCTNKCSEPCNRPPCNEPCQKQAPCKKLNHKCIGLCGEECPKVCFECSPNNETFEIFFGYEEEKEPSFVQIDCGHIFEVRGLDQYMAAKDSASVQFKNCPKCKQPIMKCRRYMNYINETLNDINNVKSKIQEEEKNLQRNIQDIEQSMLQMIKELQELNVQSPGVKKVISHIQSLQKLFISAKKQRNSEQMQEFAKRVETLSILSMLEYYLIQYGEQQPAQTIIVKKQINYINSFAPLNFILRPNEFKLLKDFADKLKKAYNLNMQLGNIELILKATGLDNSHWYKCPNGHYYTIADCGGANEVSKCNECGSVIGGQNHALASGNKHAGEFGGRSAWDPEGFNARVQRGEINLNQIQ